jgi:hypothetical protein
LLTKIGVCVPTGSIAIYATFSSVCGNILSIIGRLVRVLKGLGVPALFVGRGGGAGCHDGLLLWPCVHSTL